MLPILLSLAAFAPASEPPSNIFHAEAVQGIRQTSSRRGGEAADEGANGDRAIPPEPEVPEEGGEVFRLA